MMETTFYILLSMKTTKGPESFARYFIGNNREAAHAVFLQMKGSREVDENDVLYMDFMETKQGLPVNLELISCTLPQITENCRVLIREIFKMNNLQDL